MDSYDKLRADYERLRLLNEQHCVEAWKQANGYDDLLAAYSRATDALNFLRRVAEGGYIVSSAALTPEQIAYARAGDRMFVTEDGRGYVYNAPGDHRELVESLHAERDAALAKAADYKRDWYEAKIEFGTASAKLRERVRALESERDNALAKVAALEAKLDAVTNLVEEDGCSCICNCDYDANEVPCEPCLACRMSAEVSR